MHDERAWGLACHHAAAAAAATAVCPAACSLQRHLPSLPWDRPGASAGIGEACAWRFAEAGCKLVLIARREARLQAMADAIKAAFPEAAVHTRVLDVQDLEAVARIPEELPEQFRVRRQAGEGRAWAGFRQPDLPPCPPLPSLPSPLLRLPCCPQDVHVLLPNAGLALGTEPVHELSMEDAKTMIDTNGKRLTRAACAPAARQPPRTATVCLLLCVPLLPGTCRRHPGQPRCPALPRPCRRAHLCPPPPRHPQ